jgi:hypothetical protein
MAALSWLLAANSERTAMPGPGRRFQKGVSGNPTGRPKQDQNVTELARAHGPRAIAVLAELMNDEKATVAARVSAAGMLLDRAFGKAPSFSTSDVNDFRHATELSDEEVIRIATAGGVQIEPMAAPKAPPRPQLVGKIGG